MSNEILASLIALFGVIVSVLVSLLISMRNTKFTLQKFREEMRQRYADKLLEKRTEIYPSLYSIISSITKSVRNHKANKDLLKNTLNQLNDWDNQNSIFLSGRSHELEYRLRLYLKELLNKDENELTQYFAQSAESIHFIRTFDELKISLKTDLGIYKIEFPEDTYRFKRFEDIVKRLLAQSTMEGITLADKEN